MTTDLSIREQLGSVTTRLTQEAVTELEDANQIFGTRNELGGTPIVVTSKRSSKFNALALFLGGMMAFVGIFLSQIPVIATVVKPMIFSGLGIVTYWPLMLFLLGLGLYPLFVLKIPSGVYAMMTKHGRYIGVYDAGKHLLWPWFKVAYMVTRQSTSYNAPVKNCPTADNVMVKVDLLVVFHIDNPEEFVYKLGAEKFGDLLASTAEEGIRSLVRGTSHDHAYELRGKGADEMIGSLNEIFSDFGVTFTSATITNVVLPTELCATLENQTVYAARKMEQEKQQEYELKVLNDKEALSRKELDKKNERLSADETARRDRMLIQKESAEVDAQKEKRLAEIAAEERSAVMSIEAEGMQRAAALKAEALRIQSLAEGEAAQPLARVRMQELELERLKVLAALAANSKVVISGNNGDNLLAQLTAAGQAKDVFALAALDATPDGQPKTLASVAS